MELFFDHQRRSTKLLCPNCGTCSISVILRCDRSDWDCLTVASCQHCGRSFDAAVLPTYEERYRELREMAKRSVCSACGADGRLVRFLCDRVAKECFFHIVCTSCGEIEEV